MSIYVNNSQLYENTGIIMYNNETEIQDVIYNKNIIIWEKKQSELTVFSKSAYNAIPSVYNSSVIDLSNFSNTSTSGTGTGYGWVEPDGNSGGSKTVYKSFDITLPNGYTNATITIGFHVSGSYQNERYVEYYLNPEMSDGYCGEAFRTSNAWVGNNTSDYTGTGNGSGTVSFKISAKRSGTGDLSGGPWIKSVVIS